MELITPNPTNYSGAETDSCCTTFQTAPTLVQIFGSTDRMGETEGEGPAGEGDDPDPGAKKEMKDFELPATTGKVHVWPAALHALSGMLRPTRMRRGTGWSFSSDRR